MVETADASAKVTPSLLVQLTNFLPFGTVAVMVTVSFSAYSVLSATPPSTVTAYLTGAGGTSSSKFALTLTALPGIANVVETADASAKVTPSLLVQLTNFLPFGTIAVIVTISLSAYSVLSAVPSVTVTR